MFTLILVLATGNGLTNVVADFTSFEACEKARVHIVESFTRVRYFKQVMAQGCFKK